MIRTTDRRVQVKVPAIFIIFSVKMGDGPFQLCGANRLITGRKTLPARAKHAVKVAAQKTFILSQRLRVTDNDKQAPA